MGNPQVVVDFIANTANLVAGLRKTESAAGKTAGGIGKLGKAGLAAASAAGVGALVAIVKTGADEFQQAEKVAAQTNAVLKSTGGIAHVTAGQVDDLATSIMKKTGIDDEAVKSGENLLLTFTNVRNEAGKGNDVFTQATKTMTDMSVALGQDMKTSAVQLGKALNDPVKGVTALQRVGVSFTKAQKDQIKTLVESGDTIGAQKLVLGELRKEFGGSADAAGKTFAGQLNILKQTFSNTSGEIMAGVVPALKTVLTIIQPLVANATALKVVVLLLAGAWVAYKVAVIAATIAQMGLNSSMLLVVGAVAAIGVAVYLVIKYWDDIVAATKAAAGAIVHWASVAWDWIKANWPLLLGILTGPIGLAVVAIAKHWDAIKSAVQAMLTAVRGAITGGMNAVRSAAVAVGNAVYSGIVDAIKGIGNAVWGAVQGIGAVIATVFTTVTGWGTKVGNWIVSGVLAGLRGIGNEAWSAIQGIGAVLATVWDTIIGWGRDIGQKIIQGIVAGIQLFGGAIKSVLKAPINAVIDAWNSARIPGFHVDTHIPGIGKIGWDGADLPNIRRLAKGGIVTRPTLALVGEAGPEAVLPLGDLAGGRPIDVRVFIGDQELRGLVRTEIRDSDTGLARMLLAGAT